MDLPIENGESFHSKMLVYQRVVADKKLGVGTNKQMSRMRGIAELAVCLSHPLWINIVMDGSLRSVIVMLLVICEYPNF